MTERTRLAVLLLTLALTGSLLSFAVLANPPRVLCVSLGGGPLTPAEIKQFHLPPEQEAYVLQCALHDD